MSEGLLLPFSFELPGLVSGLKILHLKGKRFSGPLSVPLLLGIGSVVLGNKVSCFYLQADKSPSKLKRKVGVFLSENCQVKIVYVRCFDSNSEFLNVDGGLSCFCRKILRNQNLVL